MSQAVSQISTHDPRFASYMEAMNALNLSIEIATDLVEVIIRNTESFGLEPNDHTISTLAFVAKEKLAVAGENGRLIHSYVSGSDE